MNRSLFALAIFGLVSSSACSSCSKKDEAPPPPPSTPHGDTLARPPPAMPPPGSDADRRRIAALDLAKKIDGELASFKHPEPKKLGDTRAELWFVDSSPKFPKKLVITDLDASGTAVATTEEYFDDRGFLAFARAPDGFFTFELEGLSLWLDTEQRVKKGVKPQLAGERATALKKQMNDTLTAFGVR